MRDAIATGLEMHDTLETATANLGIGSDLTVNTDDSHDLRKLKISDVRWRGYNEKVGAEVK